MDLSLAHAKPDILEMAKAALVSIICFPKKNVKVVACSLTEIYNPGNRNDKGSHQTGHLGSKLIVTDLLPL